MGHGELTRAVQGRGEGEDEGGGAAQGGGLVLRSLLYRIDFIWNWGLTRGEYDRYRVNVKSVVKVPRSRFCLHSLLTTYNSLMFH